jgi:hypothetical protein
VKRFLFTFFASASLILFMVVVVVWVRSYRVENRVSVSWYRVSRLDNFMLFFEISHGGVSIDYFGAQFNDPYFLGQDIADGRTGPWEALWFSKKAQEYPSLTELDVGNTGKIVEVKIVAGFGACRQTWHSGAGEISQDMQCVAPLWSMALLFALLPVAWLVLAWRRRRNSRRLAGHCSRCGYDLRDSPEICLECGSPSRLTRVDGAMLVRVRRRTLLAAGLGAAFVPCLVLLLAVDLVHQWHKDRDIFYQFRHLVDLDDSLCQAAQDGNNDAICANLDAGAKIETKGYLDIHGPPLVLAADNGHVETAKLLLARGANVNAISGYDGTPLHAAVRKNNLDLILLMLSHGANINATGPGKGTPLDEAVNENKLELVRLLIAKGADVNVKDDRQITPLLSAAVADRDENAPIADFLIAHGADINAKNDSGESVLEIAVEGDRFEIVEQLIAHGADVNTVDQEGNTPLKIARQNGFRFMENLLLKNGAKQ